ncbi:MAG: hypothetical protein ACKO8Q_03620, partial [Bacteroidota bacterium]
MNPEETTTLTTQSPVQPKTTETTQNGTEPTNLEETTNLTTQSPVQPKSTETTQNGTEPVNPEENTTLATQTPVQTRTTESTENINTLERLKSTISELDALQLDISTQSPATNSIEIKTLKGQLNLANTLLDFKIQYGDSLYSTLFKTSEIEGLIQGISQASAQVNSKRDEAQRFTIDEIGLKEALAINRDSKSSESVFEVSNTTVLPEETMKVLSSERSYDEYITLRKEFATIRGQVTNKIGQLDSLKLTLYRATNPEETTLIITQSVSLAKEIEKLEAQERIVMNTINAIPNHEAYHYLIEQGVVPLGANGTVSLNQANVAFKLNVDKKQGNVFPILNAMPNGLIFRVQVGVFRKPVPDYFFREFTPVTGERLTNDLTAYLTGFFASSKDAISAKAQVRNTGYTDAFIVAYCDGKRIPYQVALNYE